MTANSYHMKQHPAPHAARVKLYESFFGLFGGPLAWFIQLCAGYALATQPCFVDGARASQPLAALHWTWQAMVALMVVAVAASLVSLVLSWGAFKRTALEVGRDQGDLMETGSGRTRFLALWGMVLGGSFAVATAVTAVAFITLPRCAG
jgi:hypothetical protein